MAKMLFNYLLLLALFVPPAANAQLHEDFDDADFLANPVWSGNTSDFIVNSSLQLQSNNTVANSNFFLSTPNTLANGVEWEMFVQLNFNPSSANYVDVYIISAQSDLTLPGNSGYFVRTGNTDDEISLYRKDASGISTKIIDGEDGILNKSNNILKLKITRDDNSKWTLARELSGTGNSFATEGSAIDSAYSTSAFFGFLVKQSTASFFQKHLFDDIEIRNYVPDTIPPSIVSASTISSNSVDLLFSEAVDKSGAELTTNYFADKNLGNPTSALIDVSNPALVHLIFGTPFGNAINYTLILNDVSDLSGNPVNNATATFSYYTAQRYDVVIDEFMSDPTPQVGLPDNEWIELRNISSFNINLKGWQIGDLTGRSGPMPDFTLAPDRFVIVCSASSFPALQSFGNVVSVTSFPSLDNDGDAIALFSADGKTIHSIEYSSDWYQNDLKKDGGWSLEMIDSKNPCSGMNNWKASVSPAGGTPCKLNSVNGNNPDGSGPMLLKAFATTNTTITLVFDEPLDSLRATTLTAYWIDNGIAAVNASASSPAFNKINLTLNSPLTPGTIYTITASGISDCMGNVIGSGSKARFGLSQEADSLDIVINEILFNPKPNGADYVELYNRSKKIIDLGHMFIANRSSNAIGSIQKISSENMLLFPEDYIALTADPKAIKLQYLAIDPDAFITVKSLPSYPDDKGNVIVMNNQGNIVDEVSYNDKWHFPLISNSEGIALERIDYNGESVQANFHSAASSVGYGTPGYKNSQSRLNQTVQGTIKVSPGIFSPDNDGFDDFATIDYSFPATGYVTNITIFDASGRPVRFLEKNSLSGTKGYYRWDGLDDKSRRLPQGIYVIYTEIFNTEGKKSQFKNTIVLARRF